MKGILSFIVLLVLFLVFLVGRQKSRKAVISLTDTTPAPEVTRTEYGQGVLAIAAILSDQNLELTDKLTYCINDYDGYFNKYQGELNQRGINDKHKISFKAFLWLIMTDELIRLGSVASCDWKYSLADFTDSLSQQLAFHDLRLIPYPEEVSQTKIFAPEAFTFLSSAIPAEYVLVNVGSDDDNYQLAIVQREKLRQLVDLAIGIGQKIEELV